MEAINTFEGGMFSDLSKTFSSIKQYLKALNMRPIGNLGSANGALSSIKGNNCEVSFPKVRGVYRLKFDKQYDEDGVFLPGIITITINGDTTNEINITETLNYSNIYDYIVILPNCYTGTYAGNNLYAVSYNDNYLTIYQNPEYTGCVPISSVEPDITITQVSGDSTMLFLAPDDTLTSTQTAFINPIDTEEALIIIGSTFINENTYLFTCSDSGVDNTGQIWELRYDNNNLTSYLKLIYNSNLNFSKEFPIPPTAAIGRYETENIQRIYWSDNNNPIRSLNVKDSQLMSLPQDVINLRPSIQMSVPTLSDIIQGGGVNNLSTQLTIQCAYRLVKNNGAVTNYSIMSNLVNLTGFTIDKFDTSQPNFASLDGGINTAINKAIEWRVDGVDTNFDTIEFVVIIREYPNEEVYRIFKYDTQSIGNLTSFTTLFTNDVDNMIEITESEFLIENSLFTHCKTMDQKDNRLFFGNLKNKLSDTLENFDTRAFRFKLSTNDIVIKNFDSDISNNTYTILENDYSAITEDMDAVPAYNLGLSLADDPNFVNTCKYQKDSTIIGGEGPNIKYTFGTVLLKSDVDYNTPNGRGGSGAYEQGSTRDIAASPNVNKYGYRRAGYYTNNNSLSPFYNINSPNQTYYTNTLKQSMGLESFSGNIRSYELNEIYRFAIVFISKTGTAYFPKFIGDIKFPNYTDSIPTELQPRTEAGNYVPDFRSMYVDSSGAYCNIPYIDFEVTIPQGMAEEILGYHIVRVRRLDQDKTILEHGLINQMSIYDSSTYELPIQPDGDPNKRNMDPSNGTTQDFAPNDGITFHPFSYLADASASKIAANDKIVIAERYGKTAEASVWPKLTPPSVSDTSIYLYDIVKWYSYLEAYYDGGTSNYSFTVKEAAYCGQDQTVSLTSIGKSYRNNNTKTILGIDLKTAGNPTIAIATRNDIYSPNWSTLNVTNGNGKLLGFHFKHSNLRTQYGGRSVINRSNNEYISTGAFYPVTSSGTTRIKVFGGDVFHGIMDIQKGLDTGNNRGTPRVWFFPTHSVYNVDMRIGIHANADYNEAGGAFLQDTYSYNKVFSYENILATYFPRPLNFNNTSSFNNRVYFSEIKFNGETTDSWSSIPINNKYDVDGIYGGITALISLKNKMHVIQERAIGWLLINQQSLTTDQNNQEILLGVGSSVLNKHLYDALDIGSKHQWSISASSSDITFLDINRKKLYKYNGSSVISNSDMKGNRGIVNRLLHGDITTTDNPIISKGLLTTYDYTNDEFLYTFLNNNEKYTLAYNNIIDAFSSFYTFTPYIYINNHINLYSPNYYEPGQSPSLYAHNIGGYGRFYNGFFPSSVKVQLNTAPTKTKVYDNLSWDSEAILENFENIDDILDSNQVSDNVNYNNNTFSRLRCYNDYQNTDWIELDQTPITGNLRNLEQSFNVQMPRNKVNYDVIPVDNYSIFDPSVLTKTEFGERLRDKYLIVDLEYDNSEFVGSVRFQINSLSSTFRVSDR